MSEFSPKDIGVQKLNHRPKFQIKPKDMGMYS